MKVDDQQEELMAALDELLQQFGNYGPARVRGDGDIQIPLDFDLKKARTRRSNLADAFSRMMSAVTKQLGREQIPLPPMFC